MTTKSITARAPPPEIRVDTTMTPVLTVLLAAVVGVIVLPLYAAQPLVEPIASSFGLSVATAGLAATMSMVGYAAGLFLLVPLSDLIETRRIVLTTLSADVVALAAAALAPSAALLFLATFAAGVSASAIQILVPAAGSLTPQAQRGRVIGNVMSGLMIGILLSRPIAGLAGASFSWRAAYVVDAIAVTAAIAVVHRVLPYCEPVARFGKYRALIGSLWRLLAEEPVLRRRAIYQAMCMGAFGLFWTAVALRLAKPPFELGQSEIALFTLAGVGGAVVAPIAGWAGDRGWSRPATLLAHAAVVAASLLAGTAGGGWFGFDPPSMPVLSLALLVMSAVVLDIGVIGDQTLGRRAVNLLQPDSRGRLNGLYTGLFFLGGATGSAIAGAAFAQSGWALVCAMAAGSGAASLVLAAFEP
jgi:predicted MFS family arabinose efflux permease